jgi:hypothetical protein
VSVPATACRLAGLLAAAATVSGCAGVTVGRAFDCGPLAARDHALDGAGRLRALGPIVEVQASTGRTFRAVRPFYSELRNLSDDRVTRHMLWPLASEREFRNELQWRVLTAFGHDFDRGESGSRYRLMVFPLLFAGRDAQRDPYFALFPVGGSIHEFLGQDRVTFALFPLYARCSVGDREAWNVLWPLVAGSHSEKGDSFRVLPFYARSEREGRWSKRAVMWPFWTQARYDHPKSHGTAWMAWPLVGHVDLSDPTSWMVLPPLFRWSTSGELRKYYGPWPFLQHQSGRRDRLYLWPLWGRDGEEGRERGFALWPIVRWQQIRRQDGVVRSFRIAPVWSHEKRVSVADPRPEGGTVVGRYVRLWPLFSYRRSGDASRLRLVELWPLPETAGVERNWAPFWSLYTQARLGPNEEDEFLWGLYRHREEAGARSVSLFPLFSFASGAEEKRLEWDVLKGLIGYRRLGLQYEFRLLYWLGFGTRVEVPHSSP